MLRSLHSAIGEAVADDFDFYYDVLRSPFALFSGGGSESFWRPLAHQGYYHLLGAAYLDRPWLVPMVHSLLYAVCGLALMAALRARTSHVHAACAAAFLVLTPPSRALLSWASHFVELGMLTGLTLALYFATRRRIPGFLLSFMFALLCKEAALVALPFLLTAAPLPARRQSARPLALAAIGVVVIWIAGYLYARTSYHLLPPASITTDPHTLVGSLLRRLGWSIAHVLAVTLGLSGHMLGFRGVILSGYGAVLVASTLHATSRRSARLGAVAPDLAWGGLWTMMFSAALIVTFPYWSPYRGIVASLGLICATFVAVGRISPYAAPLLLLVKLVAFLLAPAPPSTVAALPPTSGDLFLDFPRLVRLQNLMHDTRTALHRALPALRHGSTVVTRNMPYNAQYAFGGNHAIATWYSDTTLRWSDLHATPRYAWPRIAAVIDFDPDHSPAIGIAPGSALAMQSEGDTLLAHRDTVQALARFDQALRIGSRFQSRPFRASCLLRMALCDARLGHTDRALSEAREASVVRTYRQDALFLVALLLAEQGRLDDALVELDTLLSIAPSDSRVLSLRTAVHGALADHR